MLDVHRAAHRRAASGCRFGRSKTTLEPAPGDVFHVQQITDVFALRNLERSLTGFGVAHIGFAVIQRRIGIAGYRHQRARCRDRSIRKRQRDDGMAGLPGDEIEGAYRRRAEHAAVRVVVHRKALCVVPQRGDGVAVEIGHYRRSVGSAADPDIARCLNELVHQPTVKRLLFVGVIVIHVAGVGLGWIETVGLL
jgi:hypothetical protein